MNTNFDQSMLNQSQTVDKKPIIENKIVSKIETQYVTEPKTIPAGGLSKHVYSSNPDDVVEENIYSGNRTSKQKNSFTTIEGERVKVGTKEKINPFNVQGVPGCVRCGGSGWKAKGRHPHPCNECAKKTVPVIDTNVVKTSPETIMNQQVPVQRKVQQEVPFVVGIQETKRMEVPRYEERVENVEIRKMEPVVQYQQVPVTKYDTVVENIPVTRSIPRTEMKDVPVVKMEEKVENVEVKKNVPRTEYQTFTTYQPYESTLDRR
jgi:hypothetical protein